MKLAVPVALLVAPFLLALGRDVVAAGPAPVVPPVETDASRDRLVLDRAVFGRSGSLRVAIVRGAARLDLARPAQGDGAAAYRWVPLFGTRRDAGLLGTPRGEVALEAPAAPGVWRLAPAAGEADAELERLAVITQVPFEAKRNGYLNGYHIGEYPMEGASRSDRYAPPSGFIEVTAENQEASLSEHFRIRQFLTKDQHRVWPKYLAIDLRLIDKLELVLQELNRMGVRAERMHVMSGYRTPQYNGPGEGGRAKLSRHTYGDAADVWVDNDQDGYMDDLNQDGRRDIGDVEVMMRAVDRVEEKHPELVGGAGAYHANSAHGPFIHIDTRGSRARW